MPEIKIMVYYFNSPWEADTMTSMKLPVEVKHTDRADYQSTQNFPQVPDIISEIVICTAGFKLKLTCTHLHACISIYIFICTNTQCILLNYGVKIAQKCWKTDCLELFHHICIRKGLVLLPSRFVPHWLQWQQDQPKTHKYLSCVKDYKNPWERLPVLFCCYCMQEVLFAL